MAKKNPTRPERWADAVALADEGLEALLVLQSEYQDWQDNLPESFDMEPVGERLDAVVSLDLKEAMATVQEATLISLPLGFGRDDDE